jgi:hypothetical protein
MEWIFLALFGIAISYAVIGNAILAIILQSRKLIPFILGGMAVVVYFRLPRDQRTKALDRLALTVLLSLLLGVLTAVVLYPRVWDRGESQPPTSSGSVSSAPPIRRAVAELPLHNGQTRGTISIVSAKTRRVSGRPTTK